MHKLRKKENKPGMNPDMIQSAETDEITAQIEAEAVLRKYDKESSYRDKLPVRVMTVIGIALACFSVFQLYTTIFTIPSQLLRIFHLTFVLIFVYILYPAYKSQSRNFIPWYDWLLVGLTLCVMLYIPLRYDYIISNIGIYTAIDTVIGIIGILLV
ncbi:MAG: hypothetical protein EOM87_10415, partial [Clostridia bacterium]|nr:hypothetical protein [Clostridia bacterium]